MGALMRAIRLGPHRLWSRRANGRRACAPPSASCSSRALPWWWRGGPSSASSITTGIAPSSARNIRPRWARRGRRFFRKSGRWSARSSSASPRRSLCARRLAAPARSQRLPGELLVHRSHTVPFATKPAASAACWRWLPRRPGASRASGASRRFASWRVAPPTRRRPNRRVSMPHASLEANPIDVPFALIYLLDRDGTVARRVSRRRAFDDAHPANRRGERRRLGSPRRSMAL